ncbi:hypothetical protein AOQ84DRAFT_386154 [Glonium stellatum]|uniref:Uncharacterized protein n=1 Tax=Glonium stellatum TaxID=574774 RepID=A0A8E2F894_9PEZI|nr:hypothetical protein AOQ84DRAFT_386154 [Glonium stellatum]
MAGISVGDLVKASKLAWDIYNNGFAKENNATLQFTEFGSDIKDLAQNLKDITSVVSNASRQRQQSPNEDGLWELSSLVEIIGDYERTLTDCQGLLHENRQFSQNTNPAYNIQWNVLVQPRIDRLRSRLQFHNSKIGILIKPLELKLLTSIHDDLASRIDAVHQSVLTLHALVVPNIDEAVRQREQQETHTILVPEDISTQFLEAAGQSHPEIKSSHVFPLKAGADAFVFHFNKSTTTFTPGRFVNERTPSSLQYLNLLKSVWIMGRIKLSAELTEADADSYWPAYIHELEENLSLECQRFTARRPDQLIAPSLMSLQYPEHFRIWLVDELPALLSPLQENEILEKILRVPLPSSSNSVKRELTLFRADIDNLKLIEKATESTDHGIRTIDQKYDIDLRCIRLTPLYAMTRSESNSLNLMLNAGRKTTTITFLEPRHLFNFQHAITGYKVYENYDQPDVQITFVLSGSRDLKEDGRIQLWLPKSPQCHTTVNESTANTAPNASQFSIQAFRRTDSSNNASHTTFTGNNGGSSPELHNPSRIDLHRITSPMNSSMRAFLNIPNATRPMASPRPSRTAASFSSSGSASRSSVSTVSTGSGIGYVHSKPQKPMLVLFLKGKDQKGSLSIVTVQIDDETFVNFESCQCNKKKHSCLISAIERKKGDLLAQRYVADRDLSSWDIAAIGARRRQELPEAAWNKLKRISIKFKQVEDRERFGGYMCVCNPKMADELRQCVKARHRGIYGEVQFIGSQRLRNYHEDRNDRVKNTFTERSDGLM